MNHSYQTIVKEGNSVHRVLASKHLGFALAIRDEQQAKEWIKLFRTKYHDANHVCYAYRCGITDVQRHSDDGEPSGTAGKPIAGAILSFQITQVLVIVVRYFGGTKLGTGGLIQAYKTAATMAIEDAGVVEKRWQRKVEIVCNYAQLPELMNILKQRQAEKQSIVQEEDCRLTYVVAEEQLTEMQAAVSAIGPMVIHLGELI
jgi:uncharacterized YigZ family protein